ncbi:hypothetical protein ACOSP7_032809 [Xanthoceras sorbifolium]
MEGRVGMRLSLMIVVVVVVMALMATGPDSSAVVEGVRFVVECKEPECHQICLKAYGSKLIRSQCTPTQWGNLCVCYHNP